MSLSLSTKAMLVSLEEDDGAFSSSRAAVFVCVDRGSYSLIFNTFFKGILPYFVNVGLFQII